LRVKTVEAGSAPLAPSCLLPTPLIEIDRLRNSSLEPAFREPPRED
jgi:hypothetical protein